MGARLAALLVATLALAGAAPAGAQEPDVALLAGPGETGEIDLLIFGPAGARVDLAEAVGATLNPLTTVVINEHGGAFVEGAARWRCDRRTRRFVANFTRTDGSTTSASFSTITPSCRNRLELTVTERVRPGGTVRVKLRDRWEIGRIRATLCVKPPEDDARCEALAIPAGADEVEKQFRVRRAGVWRLELRSPEQRFRRRIGVGVDLAPQRRGRRLPLVLIVGDSLMQQLSVPIADRVGNRARTQIKVRGGSGVAEPGFDWLSLARRQAERRRPAVSVVLLGGADPFPMTTPTGVTVNCCDEPWIVEYARRVESMMLSYGRDGAGRVVWILRPAPRQQRLLPSFAAANEAIRRAAATVAEVRLVHLDRVFTPGFTFRRVIRWRGRRVRTFSKDGVHFTLDGSAIATFLVMRAVRPLL